MEMFETVQSVREKWFNCLLITLNQKQNSGNRNYELVVVDQAMNNHQASDLPFSDSAKLISASLTGPTS